MRVILCGFGAVGRGLAGLLESRGDELYSRYGLKVRIVGAADSTGSASDPGGLDPARLAEAKRRGGVSAYPGADGRPALELAESLDADVLVETTPSNYRDAEPGMSHIMAAMRRGMHVVTANKGPLALAFPSLTELAGYNRVMLRFSGTVGGGTPILDYAKNSLRGEHITSFSGILNGTTNYILTRMGSGMTFKSALAEARKLGYVEADESLDLDGIDAAAKLVILANWIMGKKVVLGDIKREGIRGTTPARIRAAAGKGRSVKLVASCDGDLSVGPREVPDDDPLCVDGTLNAISFTSEHSGTQTVIGRGAGGTETASAMLRDLLDIRGRTVPA